MLFVSFFLKDKFSEAKKMKYISLKILKLKDENRQSLTRATSKLLVRNVVIQAMQHPYVVISGCMLF